MYNSDDLGTKTEKRGCMLRITSMTAISVLAVVMFACVVDPEGGLVDTDASTTQIEPAHTGGASGGFASSSPADNRDPQSIDNLDPATLAIMRHQEALNPALTILVEHAMKSPKSGFTSVGFEDNGLVLYWKGDMPAGMQTALAAARAVGPVQVRQAAFSKAELEQDAAKIEAAASQRNNIQSIALRGDGSGLVVEKMPAMTPVIVRAGPGQGLMSAEQAIAAANISVPVVLTTAKTTIQALTCAGNICRRTDDEAAWNGGGYVLMKHTGTGAYYGGCTAGLAVYVPAFGGQTTYILTAAHCASWRAGEGDFFYDGAGEYIGRAMPNEDWDKDLLLVDARGYRWIWDGIATTTNHKTVHSWGYAASGELVCQSGATSGTRCWLQTQPDFTYSYQLTDSDNDTFFVHGMVKACKTQGSEAAGLKGDSGAPVFTLDGDGVKAKGIVSGGDSDGTCIVFQDMADVTTDRSGAWTHVLPYTG
jgi:streptogrisin D